MMKQKFQEYEKLKTLARALIDTLPPRTLKIFLTRHGVKWNTPTPDTPVEKELEKNESLGDAQ